MTGIKTLKKFDFPMLGGQSAYDWDLLLNGSIHQLSKGEAYECKDNTIKTLIRSRAKDRGQTVKVATIEGGIVIQASDPAKADKAGAAKAKKVRKEAAKLRKAEKKAAAQSEEGTESEGETKE